MTNTTEEKNKSSELAKKVILKKATGIYILACLFILAPIGNILLSFAGSGVSLWYEPSVIGAFLATIPMLDWLWLSLLVLTGIMLFKPHKLSWSVAIFSLVFVLVINALRLIQHDPNSIAPGFLKVFATLAILVTVGVLVIAFYFRFPYLDRRTKWLSDDLSPDRRTDGRPDVSDRRDT